MKPRPLKKRIKIEKEAIPFEIERNSLFSFRVFYFDSFIKVIIRLRFTANMDMALTSACQIDPRNWLFHTRVYVLIRCSSLQFYSVISHSL